MSSVIRVLKNVDPALAEPASLSIDLPPVFAHYDFAVHVDATTGQEGTWSEDMSGLLARQRDVT